MTAVRISQPSTSAEHSVRLLRRRLDGVIGMSEGLLDILEGFFSDLFGHPANRGGMQRIFVMLLKPFCGLPKRFLTPKICQGPRDRFASSIMSDRHVIFQRFPPPYSFHKYGR